ncbi:glutamine amidotransferase [Staphylococcus devriesei]|nr:glutamine amidotransferase [Staphylococcus devriesei]
MILVIDNYDSFTYNLVDIVNQIEETIIKYPDDEDVLTYTSKVDGVIISPGPGHPLDTDCLMKIIEAYQALPILGVCLGAQALTCYYGGKVIQGEKVMHGKVDTMKVAHETSLYQGLPKQFKIMRYHSLVSDTKTFPPNLTITGESKDALQSFEDTQKLHYGIQYHPESFATEFGTQIIQNFINIVSERGTINGKLSSTQ